MSTQPTDAELDAVIAECRTRVYPQDMHPRFERAIMRAAITKWGQPSGAGEPVAWLRNTTDPQPHAVTNLKYRSAADAEVGIEYIPVYTAPQPVAREPLTDGRIEDLLICGNPTDEEKRLIRMGWDAAHGIKGGQHGTE